MKNTSWKTSAVGGAIKRNDGGFGIEGNWAVFGQTRDNNSWVCRYGANDLTQLSGYLAYSDKHGVSLRMIKA